LNGLFNELLRDLGYETRLISARVFNGKDHGPEFDHAAIIVTIDRDEYLADVGFGAFSAEPLRYVFDTEQSDPCGAFMIRKHDADYVEVVKRDDGSWHSEYIFRDVARDLPEFAEMCDFQQHSPDSHFNKSKLCSIMTENGRKTLTDRTFILTANGTKTETEVGSEEEFYDLLDREFSIRR
jgi:N-hydroxyarylamine O-acetyltransferase